jgi:hypothetical protein
MSSTAEQAWLADVRGGSVIEFFGELGVTLADNGMGEAPVSCFANADAHRHGDRNRSCSVNLGTGQWHCHGCGERGNAYHAAVKLGLSERRARELAQRHRLFMEGKSKQQRKPAQKVPSETQLRKWREQLAASPKVIERLTELKGWTPAAMRLLRLGWDGERVVFPVRNEKEKIVGVVRYLPGGNPKSLGVGKRGLFPAPELIGPAHPLFVVEGEPDAVSVWSLGLRGVAVPGAHSWQHAWAARLGGRRLVVLCDCDVEGRKLAGQLGALRWGEMGAARALVVDLEPGALDGRDVGDWVAAAAVEGGLGQLRRTFERLLA